MVSRDTEEVKCKGGEVQRWGRNGVDEGYAGCRVDGSTSSDARLNPLAGMVVPIADPTANQTAVGPTRLPEKSGLAGRCLIMDGTHSNGPCHSWRVSALICGTAAASCCGRHPVTRAQYLARPK